MKDIFPVITLYQPWATWIMREWKTIETRTHNRFACLNKKTILIHAGLTTDNSELVIENKYLNKDQIIQNPNEIVNGYILGKAYVYDYSELNIIHSLKSLIDCGLTSPLRYGLFLENIEVFDSPIKESGEMGIWYYDIVKRQKVKKPKIQTELFSPPTNTK